jgi:hypothetical protein
MTIEIESKRDVVSLELTRVEAAALAHAGDVGFRVIEALALVQRTATTEAALGKLRAAIAEAEHPRTPVTSKRVRQPR